MFQLYKLLDKTHPEISKEWHPSLNGILTPQKVSYSSNKKVWWLGKCGHEWEASINNRTNNKRCCPFCSNQKVCKENCLSTLNPILTKEWHPTLNNINPFEVVLKSTKKVWWLGQCGHQWESKIIERVNGNGCPFCSGKYVCESNSLANKFPNVAQDWHPKKNHELTPFLITAFSNKKVWWLGKCGHEWETSVCNRTGILKSGCPHCQFESKGEKIVCKTLELLKIDFKRQYKIKECKNKRTLPFDFALFNNQKLIGLIEYQGEQHYKLMRYKNAQDLLLKVQMRDKIKSDFCIQNKIRLLLIPYWKKDISSIVKKFVYGVMRSFEDRT